MGETKKEMNARVWLGEENKLVKESAVEQLCIDNISTGLNKSNGSSISDSSESLSTSLLLLPSF